MAKPTARFPAQRGAAPLRGVAHCCEGFDLRPIEYPGLAVWCGHRFKLALPSHVRDPLGADAEDFRGVCSCHHVGRQRRSRWHRQGIPEGWSPHTIRGIGLALTLHPAREPATTDYPTACVDGRRRMYTEEQSSDSSSPSIDRTMFSNLQVALSEAARM